MDNVEQQHEHEHVSGFCELCSEPCVSITFIDDYDHRSREVSPCCEANVFPKRVCDWEGVDDEH